MSLWAEYQKERGGIHFLEEEDGFVSYSFDGEECYLQDIYVRKGKRASGLATQLADKVSLIARGKGCKILTGSVFVGAQGDTSSLKVLLSYGMRLIVIRDGLIILGKDL